MQLVINQYALVHTVEVRAHGSCIKLLGKMIVTSIPCMTSWCADHKAVPGVSASSLIRAGVQVAHADVAVGLQECPHLRLLELSRHAYNLWSCGAWTSGGIDELSNQMPGLYVKFVM